jgi:hypothetical protein
LPWACIRIAIAAATSTPGLGSPCHICAATGSSLPHMHCDWAHRFRRGGRRRRRRRRRASRTGHRPMGGIRRRG